MSERMRGMEMRSGLFPQQGGISAPVTGAVHSALKRTPYDEGYLDETIDRFTRTLQEAGEKGLSKGELRKIAGQKASAERVNAALLKLEGKVYMTLERPEGGRGASLEMWRWGSPPRQPEAIEAASDLSAPNAESGPDASISPSDEKAECGRIVPDKLRYVIDQDGNVEVVLSETQTLVLSPKAWKPLAEKLTAIAPFVK